MARYLAGLETVHIPVTVRDSTGTLTDASAISLVVHQPDGTVKTYSSPAHDGTGLYHQDLPLADTTPVGFYPWVWQITLASGAGGGSKGSFDTYDPFEVTVLPLQDAKDMLNIQASDTSNDSELQRKIATITALIEKTIGGPVITRQITNERVRAGSGYRTLTVRYRPLVSVVSIADVVDNVPLSLSDLDVDGVTGIIRRKLQLPFWSRGPFYLVTYTAGLGTAVPAFVNEAAALIIQHLWETQRGGAPVAFGGPEPTVTLPGGGFGIRPRAAELLSPATLEAYF